MITEQDKVRWEYNGMDVMYTFQIAEVLHRKVAIESDRLKDFYNFQLNEISPALIDVMNTGVRIDIEKKDVLKEQLTKLLIDVEKKLEYLLDEPFNPRSGTQIKAVLKDLCNIKPIINKKTKAETFASIAMFSYREDYPEYRALIDLILEYRSISVFLKTFVSAEVDEDNRMRTNYNCAGTKTYRLSSRKNAFGKGANLANIPSKGKIDLKYSLASVDELDNTEDDEDSFVTGDYEGITELPNCKEFFIPDEGYNFFNVDYSGADAMIVAWDSNCQWLKNFFLYEDMKLYVYIGSHYLQREITTKDKEYKVYKQFIHGTNYGMMEAKAAANANMPLLEAKKLRQWYFKLCPEIPDWHRRIESNVKTKGYIENIFGARGWFLNKESPTILNQAYAWIPQSTIGILVNKGLVNIHTKEKDIKVLLQVHDALAGQYKKSLGDKEAEDRICKHMSVELPYKDKLIIPVDFSFSEYSYGACK